MAEVDQLKQSISSIIAIPAYFDSRHQQSSLQYHPVSDASVLSCGCLISESFAKRLYISPDVSKLNCPVCHSTSKILSPVEPLRKLFTLLDLKDPGNERGVDSKQSLLNLFYSIASTVDLDSKPIVKEKVIEAVVSDTRELHIEEEQTIDKRLEDNPISQKSITSSINSIESPVIQFNDTVSLNSMKYPIIQSLKPSFNFASPHHQQQSQPQQHQQHQHQQHQQFPTLPVNSIAEQKEYHFVKCFPSYRKHSQFQTHTKFFNLKSLKPTNFINTAISPSCKYFTLLTSKKWEIWKILPDDTARLYCVGTSKGEHGINFDNLVPNSQDEIKGGGFSAEHDPQGLEYQSKLQTWEHLYCAMSDSYLVISGTNGIMRVIDVNLKGQIIYTYSSNFPIRCIDISSNSQLIAYGITGKDRIKGTEQALIVMHRLIFNNNRNSISNSINNNNNNSSINNDNDSDTQSQYFDPEHSKLTNVDPITITFPYSDPINHVSISQDSNYLSCSTALESRFFTVWIKDATKPRLIMKSIRTIDTSLESEGITSIKMFPNNKFMIITSLAFNSAPIIIDNKVKNLNKDQSIAQPKLLLKIDEIGSNVHNSTVSPRNDSIAMVNKHGTVYLLFSTRMNQDSKRLFVVDQVSNAFRARESASLKFSPDGHKLYIVDRKGALYINDFAAGLPQNSDITRCKEIT